ncbi:SipW-dependent-type signal peptide-containing protein [Curtobacterium sp. MCSS17_008]|uniref:SipW-dependent-type signal peptide-containing protein n=1 Tax=Curtobacterium sp. MCSS17_008 TaxID=2175647 RepID=UPI001C6523FC|nr:SipW-dependent-type signal peptide-containing protein [Curtobacterium sp. MCSS17_008]
MPLLLAVVLGGLLGTGGTNALWTSAASTSGSTVRSGTATIAVSQLSAMNASVIGPGVGTTGTFTVRNTGTVPLSMRVAVTSTKVAYADGTTPDAVLAELTMRLNAVASASACRSGVGGATQRLADFDTGSGYYTLPRGVTATACVEVVLDSDAPQSVAGAVTDFTVTVTGTQVGP